jgi:hypothetical protein
MKKIKLKSVFTVMLILLGGIHLTYSISGGSTSDPHPAFDIPIYQGGYNIIKKFNSAGGSKTVNYSVQLKPPAAEIIEFYDSYFNGAGWISSFEICQRHWDDSADGNSMGAFPLKQMYASWEHPELDLKIVLWLKHDPTGKQVRDVVKVECRLQKKNGG